MENVRTDSQENQVASRDRLTKYRKTPRRHRPTGFGRWTSRENETTTTRCQLLGGVYPNTLSIVLHSHSARTSPHPAVAGRAVYPGHPALIPGLPVSVRGESVRLQGLPPQRGVFRQA